MEVRRDAGNYCNHKRTGKDRAFWTYMELSKPTGLSDCLAAEEEGRRVKMVERGSLVMGPFIEPWESPGRN